MPRNSRRPCVKLRQRRYRHAAGALERGEEGALGSDGKRCRLVIDGRQQLGHVLDRRCAFPPRWRPAPPPAASPPPGRARRRELRGPAASGRPSPAGWHRPNPRRSCAGGSRRCRAWGRRSRSGRRCFTCAWRRSEEVATTAPAGRSERAAAVRLIKASRTSSRGRKQLTVRPAGSRVGMSFMECTAMSTSPASSASSISLVNRPLPPASLRGRSWMRSPVVRMG